MLLLLGRLVECMIGLTAFGVSVCMCMCGSCCVCSAPISMQCNFYCAFFFTSIQGTFSAALVHLRPTPIFLLLLFLLPLCCISADFSAVFHFIFNATSEPRLLPGTLWPVMPFGT